MFGRREFPRENNARSITSPTPDVSGMDKFKMTWHPRDP
jgi:hypothetical protein